jgi:Lysyl oxidase
MDAGWRSGRLGLAAAVLTLGVVAVTIFSLGARPAGAGDPPAALLPDLIVLKPSEVLVDKGRKRTMLRFSHTTANIGDGPLEIAPDLEADECAQSSPDWFDADQYVYRDTNGTGEFERGADAAPEARSVGCMFFHKPHDHYHFRDFALYRLYRERTGNLAGTSDKVSFCVFDLLEVNGDLPGAEQYYMGKSCKRSDGMHGISVGWADIYGAFTQGQELDVTGKRRGRYCLVASADPDNRLDESNNANNVRRVRIALRPRKGVVKRLPGPCKNV